MILHNLLGNKKKQLQQSLESMLCLFGKLKVLTNGLLRKHIIEAGSLLEWFQSKLIKERIADKLRRSFDINIYVKAIIQ